ncbi:2OG-Fe(II) oxygenase [Hydrogenophaga crassostreae]|uniref:2OG-Fe(II) oxygenase n=1 Tax=Hydrogenophaga crassostreae TaxID=1763535 RepID=UPI000B051F1F|nr:2OG-Fe(II) oxygenase [Hydrogenophaga crassostreae]
MNISASTKDTSNGRESASTMSPSLLPIDAADGFHLNSAEARSIGENLSGEYCFAEPFPHIVIDNFLPEDVIRLALDNFPTNPIASDTIFEMGYAGQHKRQVLPEDCDAPARRLFHFFNSAPFVEFLEGLSSIQGLIPDPYFVGGGYHETGKGGYLGVHADFRINDRLHLNRRMNVIIYLNEHWPKEYGGELELWDREMKNMHASVSPVFNRCVIFNTDADSYHGHPDPLTCPEGVFRRSIALYYYTASKEIYKEVPSNSTIYFARPHDGATAKREAFNLRLDQHLHQWVPPALQRYVFAVKRKLGL